MELLRTIFLVQLGQEPRRRDAFPYLSKRQVDIMIKYYYTRSLVKVAKDENVTTNQVKGLVSNGLRIMRLAYSHLYWQGLYFDVPAVFKNMADAAGFTEQELSDRFQQYIEAGFASKDHELWEHAAAGKPFTPFELLTFLWEKFEADIVPMYTWDLFGNQEPLDLS